MQIIWTEWTLRHFSRLSIKINNTGVYYTLTRASYLLSYDPWPVILIFLTSSPNKPLKRKTPSYDTSCLQKRDKEKKEKKKMNKKMKTHRYDIFFLQFNAEKKTNKEKQMIWLMKNNNPDKLNNENKKWWDKPTLLIINRRD